jgi:hypothetical protein
VNCPTGRVIMSTGAAATERLSSPEAGHEHHHTLLD